MFFRTIALNRPLKHPACDENERVIDEKVTQHEDAQAQYQAYLDTLSVSQLIDLLGPQEINIPEIGEIDIPDSDWLFSDLPDFSEVDWDHVPVTKVTQVVQSTPTYTTQQRWYKIGKEYERRKKHQGAPYGNKNASPYWSGTVVLDNTAEKIAEKYLCAPRKVSYCAAYARAVDKIARLTSERIKDAILSREIPLKRRSVLQLMHLPDEKIKQTILELAKKYGVAEVE